MSITELEYRRRAQLHRPADQRVAVMELAAHGLRAADIARLLSLSEPAVTSLLQRHAIASGAMRSPTLQPDEAAAVCAAAWSQSQRT